MKPSWSGAPVWAKWLAQDSDGRWFWYEFRPYTGRREWGSDVGQCIPAGEDSIPLGPLEPRP